MTHHHDRHPQTGMCKKSIENKGNTNAYTYKEASTKITSHSVDSYHQYAKRRLQNRA
jgi:hypothetical protein